MTVTLTPHLKKFVNAKVKSGGYADASEVVREALRLLEKVDKLEPADLEALIAEADGEPSTPMTAEDWNEVRQKVLGKERKAAA